MLYAFNGVTKTTLVSYNKLFDEYNDVTYTVVELVNGSNANVSYNDKIMRTVYPDLTTRSATVV